MAKKPNIILFVTDDHGYWANSCYGNKDVISPALDFLASKGTVMQNAFTPTPVCSPSRACVFTGRIASQHGMHDYLGSSPDVGVGKHPWLAGEDLLPNIMRENGYNTGLVGKWHMGNHEYTLSGFDYVFSTPRVYPVEQSGPMEYFENEEGQMMCGYTTDIITDKSVQFIRERCTDAEQPFFLHVAYTGTHHPWEGHPERFVEMYRHMDLDTSFQGDDYPFGIQNLESTFETRKDPREALAQYYASVSHIDEGIGRIVDEVYAAGLADETVIIYTSDHGLNCGHHGIWGKGNGTLPLNLVEETIRIPLIISSPGDTLYPQRRTEFVDHTDLFQTILDLAGIKLDKKTIQKNNYPGGSFQHLLKHDVPQKQWRDFQCCEYGDVRMIRDQRYKLVMRYPDGPNQFFDLEKDPGEKVNFHADPACQEIIERLRAKMDDFYAAYEDAVNSGLNVKNLPIHNSAESWRDPRNLH